MRARTCAARAHVCLNRRRHRNADACACTRTQSNACKCTGWVGRHGWHASRASTRMGRVVRRAGVGVRAPSRRSLARRKSAAHIDVQGTPAMLLKQRNMDPCMRQAMRHARRKPRANAPYISKRVKRKGRQYQAMYPSEHHYERRWYRPCPKPAEGVRLLLKKHKRRRFIE